MAFQREKQSVAASDLLQALADGEDIQLSQCTITGTLDINRLFTPSEKFQTDKLNYIDEDDRRILTLTQPIVFDRCVFEENVFFSSTSIEQKNLTVEFKSDCTWNRSVFKGLSQFENAVFEGMAAFDGCDFQNFTSFKNTTMKKDARFRTVSFNGYVLFSDSTFESPARFASTHFVRGVNFSKASFLGTLDFGGAFSSSRTVPVTESVVFARGRYGEDESFWRFVKQSAQDAGYYHLAGECFYFERCAGLWKKMWGGYDSLTAGRKILRCFRSVRFWPELVFGKMLFGYGERPVRVLIASALIVLLCALVYSAPGSLVFRGDQPDHSFLRGLYFSTITFTTLGYGDLYPAARYVPRIVAMAEAVAGASLMALFIVCLAKRFSRS